MSSSGKGGRVQKDPFQNAVQTSENSDHAVQTTQFRPRSSDHAVQTTQFRPRSSDHAVRTKRRLKQRGSNSVV